MVTQETVLFNDTISNNIKYGKLNANDKEVENAIKTILGSNQLDIFIGSEDGLLYGIDSNGNKQKSGNRNYWFNRSR